MWNLIPLTWRVGLAAAAIALALGGGAVWLEKAKHDAYVSGYDKATALCEEAAREQAAANKKAAQEAAKKLDELTKQLELKELQVDDILKGIDLAADADPRNSVECLDPLSVRRLNTIQ